MSHGAFRGVELDGDEPLISWWNGLRRARRRQARSRRRRGPAGPGFTASCPAQRIATARQCRRAGAVRHAHVAAGSRSADLEHVADLPLAAWSGLAASLGAFNLPLADMRQDGAEVLVLDNACLRNLPQLVEGGVRQVAP